MPESDSPREGANLGRRSSRKKHRRTKKLVLKDTHRSKRFPSSIALTILAVREYWLQQIGVVETDEAALSVARFLDQSDFAECWLQVMSLYPSIKRAPDDAPERQLYDIPQNACNMDYFKLRAFAKFTGVRSAAMFLLFSQLVGEELRAINDKRDPKHACTQILEGVRRILDRTEEYMNAGTKESSGRYFWRQYSDTRSDDAFLPNVELLKLWRDAFLDGELPPDPINPLDAPELRPLA